MNCKNLCILISISLMLFSCSQSSGSKDTAATTDQLIADPQESPQKQQPPIPVGNPQQAMDSSRSTAPVPVQPTEDWDKKIIKTATLKLEVKDFNNYAANIYKTVKQYGGYIAEENQNSSDEKIESILTIKVPVIYFENIMNQLPVAEVKIIERKIAAEDVTGEVVDVKGRLEAKKQMRQRYFDFFKEAKNMQEVLQVQAEIDDLQESMESAASRVSYLSHQSAMSTIHLTFYQPLEGFRKGGSTISYLSRIGSAFETGGEWLGNIILNLISIWPFILIISLGAFLVRKFSASKSKQAKS